MEQEIQIREDNTQLITINSITPQSINMNNISLENIDVRQSENQNVNIKENKNQILYIDDTGAIVDVTDVLVNGLSVVSDHIAYVKVPTKTSELKNDNDFISKEIDPTVPIYVKQINEQDISSWNNKQNLLVSGTNIKTINNNSILGSGNIEIAEYEAGTGIDITSHVISNTITSYEDLEDLPTIPSKTSQLQNDSNFVIEGDLSEVAFSGDYEDLTNKPFIPTETNDLINNSGFIDKDVNDLTYYTLSSSLSTVATSGNYNDLSNKPTIPTQTSDLNNDSGFIDKDVNNLTYYTLSSNLSAVATSGNYNDLSNKPSIPTQTSDLNNDSGFIDKNVNDLTNYTLTSSLTTWNSRASNITINNGYTLQENRTYVNQGIKLCYVHINVKATSTSGDIASGLPKALESMTLYAMNATTNTPVLVWVRAAGTLACYTPHAVNDEIKVSGCYPYSSL